jgi:4-hydroxybenzoate polyprenyltransferase
MQAKMKQRNKAKKKLLQLETKTLSLVVTFLLYFSIIMIDKIFSERNLGILAILILGIIFLRSAYFVVNPGEK